MLRSISILNYALIRSLTVDLGEGLNVITGETGAGKSIVIDAISLLLGERGSKDNLRIGSDRMTVSASFDTPEPGRDDALIAILDEAGIDASEELIVSREMDKRGRSVCRINGVIVPLALLKKTGPQLIDVHGQHEHASLFKAENHRIQLDAYAGEEAAAILTKLSETAGELRASARTIRELESRGREEQRREEFDRYALDEIDGARLETHEEDSLRDEKNLLAHAEQLYSESAAARQLLSADDDPDRQALIDEMSELAERIETLSRIDPYFQPFPETVQGALAELENLAHELGIYEEQIDFSPGRLEEIESRLSIIEDLKRKYGEDVSSVLAYAEGLREKLDGLENADERLDKLKAEYTKKRAEYSREADRLHELREKTGQTFARELEGELRELAMEKARVEVRIDEDDKLISSHGKDSVEFMISVNPGVPPRPLRKIASGGEISRIMLSLKCMFGEKDKTGTMIFDEIDTGISGRTAQSVAEKILKLSGTHQIICITHLPQIAATADRHFLVEKASDDRTVEVSFSQLDSEQRTDELARMLGGAEVTETTRSHAREMIEQSDRLKAERSE